MKVLAIAIYEDYTGGEVSQLFAVDRFTGMEEQRRIAERIIRREAELEDSDEVNVLQIWHPKMATDKIERQYEIRLSKSL